MLDVKYALEDFEPHVGTDFKVIHDGDAVILLTLLEAHALKDYRNGDGRPPFGLLLQSVFQEVIPQQLFSLHHDAMGDLGIFLVPTARNETGIQYYATFN
ncbi:MAG: hypothetical protein JWN66_4391 [Sphingomonas bacterium]|jgi:hypothetical protein|uniref:DUF6916 family protein n=1 Tax=Sphingomonas bacterium TaxID=1895847 RepID=UPI00263306C1|nr:hypothetical protein [Sphingomonas bacterium]MDB5707275.1 hypothetical protein [Sphingomonas bacterium]